MNNDGPKTLALMASIVAALYAIMSYGQRMEEMIGHAPIFSRFEFYFSVALAGVCFYLLFKIRGEKDSREKAITKIAFQIKAEYETRMQLFSEKVVALEDTMRDRLKNIENAIQSLNDNLIDVSGRK